MFSQCPVAPVSRKHPAPNAGPQRSIRKGFTGMHLPYLMSSSASGFFFWGMRLLPVA